MQYAHGKPQARERLQLNNEMDRESSFNVWPDPPKSYAFCSDAAYAPDLIDLVQELITPWATFLDIHQDLAQKTKHSTAAEAAQIAAKAEVGQLILGHFFTLSRFKRIYCSAWRHFQNVHLAEDGKGLLLVKSTYLNWKFLFFWVYGNLQVWAMRMI